MTRERSLFLVTGCYFRFRSYTFRLPYTGTRHMAPVFHSHASLADLQMKESCRALLHMCRYTHVYITLLEYSTMYVYVPYFFVRVVSQPLEQEVGVKSVGGGAE